MRTTHPHTFYQEQIVVAHNRSGQIEHEIGELEADLNHLVTAVAELVERSRTFTPERKRDGFRAIDPAVDTSDPREILAILTEKLRRIEENLGRAANLLQQRRDTIRSLIAG